jgi:thiol-disulfide isomerase/thioredoxin
MNATQTPLGLIGKFSGPLALLLILGCAPTLRGADTGLKVGDAFPDLSTFSLEGDLPAALKGRIVVVDFWASWCAPCKETFPLLEELHHRFSKQGLVILAVNEDKSRTAMAEFLKEHPVTYSVVRDPKKKLAAQVNVPGLPTSYILDREGKVLLIESGTRIARNRRGFVKEIERLVQENAKEKR